MVWIRAVRENSRGEPLMSWQAFKAIRAKLRSRNGSEFKCRSRQHVFIRALIYWMQVSAKEPNQQKVDFFYGARAGRNLG